MSNATSTMAAKSATCPACGETFQDLRGLNGHLRFKHQFESERVTELMDEAKQDVRERREAEGEEPQDSVLLAMDRVQRCEARKKVARKVLKQTKRSESVGAFPTTNFFKTSLQQDVAEDYLEKCEEELEEAHEALESAIEREVNRREAQEDE